MADRHSTIARAGGYKSSPLPAPSISMTEEILINVTPRETRVALVENGMLQEVHVERASRRGYVGNIYKGRISRVMPGMQAAFVEIGLDRAAFLHASDIVRVQSTLIAENGEGTLPATAPTPTPPINELLRDGQEIVVQVVKDPIGTKGARLTTHLSIPSRYLVLLPYSKVLGVSVRIEDESARARLKEVLGELLGETRLGYIVRTNAEGESREALAEDVNYLGKLWATVQENIARTRVGECIYEDLSLPLRALRDLMRPSIEKVRIDSHETLERAQRFVKQFMPELGERVEHYPGERPIFDLYGVEDEIQKALRKDVPLKSGGYLIVDQTEAMTTIDVNTGGFLGSRNLGGIIIIDFIDMVDQEHQRQVLRQLQKSMTRDHAKATVYDMSPLGLVEMTRKRTTESLERQLCEPCPTCTGRGSLRSAETITYEIFREITRAVRQFEANQLLVLASPKVVNRILEEESVAVAELEEFIGKTIRFQPEEHYSQEQYDVVLL